MAWPGEHNEQAQQGWRSRFAKKRADLSISVEETLADGTLEEELIADEQDEQDEQEEQVQGKKSSVVIPPRLSLQSKSIPVVRVEPKEATKVVVVDTRSTTGSVEVPQSAQKKQRLAGRTTKVRLQAVPKSEKKSGGKMLTGADKNEQNTADSMDAGVEDDAKRSSAYEAGALIEGQLRSMARGALSGSAMFKQGQREVVVFNAYISPASVVMAVLLGDPGPVVIKYISLQPQIGFTVHLSAPAEAETSFNYVILMGELF